MNKIKISRLRLENFKLFDARTFDFEDKDLVVLDGPNGFGKTSLFDAIELLITRNITRINRAAGTLIKSFSYNDPLLLCREAIENRETGETCISVTMEVSNEEGKFVLCRRMKCTARTDGNAYPDNFSEFNLYQLPNFESDFNEGALLTETEEKELVSQLFGSTILHYYSLFYYIEQEDSTHFLKRGERDRKEFISSLFDTTEQEFQSKKIDIVRKRLSDKLKELSTSIGNLLSKREEAKGKARNENIDAETYKSVLTGLDVHRIWDIELERLEEDVYNAGKKELQSLEDFLATFNVFKQDRINAKLIKYAENFPLLRSTIALLHFLPEMETIRANYNTQLEILQARQKLQGDQLTKTLLNNLVDFGRISSLLQIQAPSDSLQNEIEQLRRLQANANDLDLLIRDLNNSRLALQAQFNKVRGAEGIKDSECPLCGFDWSDFEQLLAAMQQKEDKFTSLFKGNIEQISALLHLITDSELKPLIEALKRYEASNILIQEAFYSQLLEASKQKNEIVSFSDWLNKYGISIDKFLRTDFNAYEPISPEEVQTLGTFIIEQQQPADKDLIPTDASSTYKDFFKSNEDNLKLISISDLQAKNRYLDYQWHLTNSSALKTIDASLEQARSQKTKLDELHGQLNEMKGIYKKELNIFRSKVIRDIEIPFYLYSARIIQSYQRGLGLFIHGEGGQELKSIKFLSDLNSNHDALFSLSSGQLTALVIAFSLALNKIYAENSLLLIDDPTQTMDEINVASLVELLRNEFGDRQIFLSTHEDDTSMYLRYKFQKYGKETKRINLKETTILE
ncbi:AAA family ATPase [Nibribacter ruber]|uniref:AAA family ATPase n=1 Tax=Nibribacter ruber TaxID=2698458 RepID=A0A6P1NY43_9BACT|nr:AAA family ATPase [Nibribacter ruber]QHL87950.1 AAA family ATPase [Nibribacter ruber]